MRIGIAGLAKGYRVDRAAALLARLGISDYAVDGGGDIRLAGSKADRPWIVGIAAPRREGQLHATLEPARGAIVTSGDYQRYFEKDGVRYHHILDPVTGRPARASVASPWGRNCSSGFFQSRIGAISSAWQRRSC